MKLSIVHKFSLSTVLLVLLCSSVIGGFFYFKTSDLLVKHSLDTIEDEIRNTGIRLQNKIEDLYSEVLILSKTPPIQGLLRANNLKKYDEQGSSTYDQWSSRLESIFKTVLNSKPAYLTLRYLDKNGQELIVVSRLNKNITVIKGNQLQNKKNRRYFKEGVILANESVYLSEINLNREYGKISLPHHEVLRTSTPIYDERSGEIAGLVVITTEIGYELKNIHDEIKKTGRNIYITNDQGGYLLHPEKRKAYGFDLGKRYRMQEDIPQLARLFLPDNSEMQRVLKPEDTNSQYVIGFTKIPFDPANSERYITVTMTQSFKDIVTSQSEVLNDMMLWALFLASLGAGIAILISVRITRPLQQMTQVVDDFTRKKASSNSLPVNLKDEIGILARSFASMIQEVEISQNNLEELNDSLENQVIERTRLLKQSEAQQKTIFRAIADAIITIDDNGIIDSFNPAAEKIFGYSAEEVVGKNVSILLQSSERDAHESFTNNSSLHASRIIHRTRDLEGRRKDGDIFPMELNVTPMQGEVSSGYVGILRDITAREHAKKALLNARDEAENANHAKSQFLSSMSHELRTPLNAIIGFSQLLQMSSSEPLSTVQGRHVDEILKGGQHLLMLINEVLDLSRIESGHIELSIEAIELDELIAEAIKLIEPLAIKQGLGIYIKHNGVPVQIEDLAQLHNIVRADRTRLKQVLLNLLSNAVKYNSKNGSVTISYETKNQGHTHLSIIDTGSGLTPDQLTQLFKPFSRLGAEQSDIEGTGIGLVITKNIIELMSGSIGVSSQSGKGSTFWIEIPSDNTADSTNKIEHHDHISLMPRSKDSKETLNEQSVLYIEDNPTNLRLVNLLLARLPNLHMWSAHEPFLGLELAIEHQPDLILLDINMPGMNGFEVLKHLKQHKETCDIAVIALSANAMQKDIDKGLAAGFDDYITKPINAKILLETVSARLSLA